MTDEDNSPFAEPPQDEFTDLPLNEESQPIEDDAEDSSDHPTQPSDTPAPPSATSITPYNPEMYTSTLQHSFADRDAAKIEIVDAGKSREGQSRGYIVYTINCNGQLVRRRYSEFESLRNSLVRLFPTLVVPPIPEKHAITKYATVSLASSKEDTALVEHRRRMLGVFLNRCLQIRSVRECSVFQSFLDPNSNWNEVLASPPLSNIPKNILQADPLDPSNSSAAHSYLPVPSQSVIFIRENEEDRKFNAVENSARDYESVISGGVEKVNKRIVKHFGDLGDEFSEAGGVFNAFSLQETTKLAPTLEKFGQVHDNTYLSTETLVNALNFEFSEPLGESVQFASVMKDVLKFRQQKALQKDITARSLKHRLNHMKLLDKAEEESKRIEAALEAGQSKTGQINFDRKVAQQQEEQKLRQELGQDMTPLEPKKQSLFKIPGMSKLGSMIKESIESDPEVTRLSTVNKLKDDINQLKHTYIAATKDMVSVSESVNIETERFQKTKDEELKKMLAAYASAMLDWSRKNLEFWEEVKSV